MTTTPSSQEDGDPTTSSREATIAGTGLGPALALIWSITAGATFLQIGNGLLQILLPLRMEWTGMSIAQIGLVASAYGFGFAAGCIGAPWLVRRVGHIRAFASLAATAAIVALAFTQAEGIATWILLRALSGMALAGLFTVIDGWVSARATTANRGRVVSLYMICTKVALILSPLAIGLGSISGDGLFMAIAALMCLSLIPVSATMTQEPRTPRTVSVIIPTLFRRAPSAVIGAFAVGLMNSSVIAIAPVYGVRVGLDPAEAALLFLALQTGSLLFQWPLGWISDRTDRRRVIAGLALATALSCLAIIAASLRADALLLSLAFGFWGGMALCIYAVCIAHASDLVEAEEIVPTISSLLVCWAVGGMIGPVPATMLMAWMGPQGLFIYCLVIALLLAGFVIWRISALERPAARGGFVNMPATSPTMATLSPRAAPVAPGRPAASSAPDESLESGPKPGGEGKTSG
ncbi:MAG: MFS transporter [Salinarimonas sp.]